jgi:cytoskeletal protein CcmA (bactofilin family)
MITRPLLFLALAIAATMAVAQPAQPVAKEAAGDRFIAGGTLRHSEPVSGDLIGVGGDVDLSAPVKGDVVFAGGSVRIRGAVGGDVYAAGGAVAIEGTVAGNVRIAGGTAEVLGSGTVNGNLAIAGGDVVILGPVKGNVHSAGGNVLIDSQVDGDVRAATGSLELGPNARIAGKLRYRGPDDIRRHPDAQVAGGITQDTRERPSRKRRAERAHESSFPAGGWLWTLGLIGLAALLAAAFPAASRRLGGELREHTGLAFLVGFLVLVGIPVLALLLMITVIGLPLALVVVLLYFLLMIVGYAAIAVVLGDAALARFKAEAAPLVGWRVGAAMLAMLALALLGRIPFVGWLVVLAALLAGIGMIVMAMRPRGDAAPA